MPLILSGDTGISGVDGSAGTPSLQGTDSNTGVFYATDIVGIATNGTERMRIDSSGNVGVGTSSIGQRFVVNGASGVALQIENSSDSNRGGRLIATGSAASGTFGVNTTSSGYALTFGIDGTERMRVDTIGNVGIGTSSQAGDARLAVSNAGAVGMEFSPNIAIANENRLLSYNRGTSVYVPMNYDASIQKFLIGGTERMRISSGGSLLFGTTDSLANITSSSGTGLALYNSSGNTQFLGTNANDTVAQLNRQGSNGELIVFRRDGNSIGNISGTTTGVTLVGTNGITFTATQTASADANTLDDYEEGTWTPTASAQSGSLTSYTSSGQYTKVGRMVYVIGRIVLTNVGTASGQLFCGGLPFSTLNTASRPSIPLCREDAVTGVVYGGYVDSNSTSFTITSLTFGSIVWTNNYVYTFCFTYQASN